MTLCSRISWEHFWKAHVKAQKIRSAQEQSRTAQEQTRIAQEQICFTKAWVYRGGLTGDGLRKGLAAQKQSKLAQSRTGQPRSRAGHLGNFPERLGGPQELPERPGGPQERPGEAGRSPGAPGEAGRTPGAPERGREDPGSSLSKFRKGLTELSASTLRANS